jgi:hypothetical protein
MLLSRPQYTINFKKLSDSVAQSIISVTQEAETQRIAVPDQTGQKNLLRPLFNK